eukprot:363930-Chlamydomonas_euryale.AAC.6
MGLFSVSGLFRRNQVLPSRSGDMTMGDGLPEATSRLDSVPAANFARMHSGREAQKEARGGKFGRVGAKPAAGRPAHSSMPSHRRHRKKKMVIVQARCGVEHASWHALYSVPCACMLCGMRLRVPRVDACNMACTEERPMCLQALWHAP